MTLRQTRFVTAVAYLMLAALGCSEHSGYPTTTVPKPEGRSAECFVCKKTIPTVEKDNMVTDNGILFVVCSEECKAKVSKVADGGHGHKH